ncbi:MAG TPA: hypothetical protein VHM88_09440, partial [Candidatus Acidoferrales bacterium]|nr:hypothetical protein [Candidatus Acidoferrales bacterium]
MLARIPASMQVFSSLAWVAALALLVGGVWLPAGYIFGTDFPGPRHFAFPDSITSFAGLQLELALLNLVFPGEVVGKILIFGILVSAGLAAFHSVPTTGLVPRAVASLVYVVNPFVYDRLAYGQLTVLAGYALLPLVASSVRRLLLEATMLQAVIVGLLLSAVAVLDVHIALIASVLVVLLVSAYMFEDRRRLESALRTGSLVLVSAAVALLTSIYWLIPLLSGRGPEAATLAGIGQSDLNSFSTTSDPNLGLLPNVLGLYGFWAEDTGRFASMKDFVPLWPVALGLMLMLAIAGAAAVWRRNENVDFPFSRAWLIALLSGAFLATVLGIGVADPHIAPVVDWLDSAFPPYRGMRDAQKWA